MFLIGPKNLASACSLSPLGIIAGKDEMHGTEDPLRISVFAGKMQSCVAAMPSLLPLLNLLSTSSFCLARNTVSGTTSPHRAISQSSAISRTSVGSDNW